MKTVLFIIFLAATCTASAQNFFKPLPKITAKETYQDGGGGIYFQPLVTAKDSSYFALRPIVSTAMVFGTNKVMAGAGVSYQNITYNYESQRSYCNYSISGLVFAGAALPPAKQVDVVSVGLMVGALNNNVGAGVCLTGKEFGFLVSYSFNFNN